MAWKNHKIYQTLTIVSYGYILINFFIFFHLAIGLFTKSGLMYTSGNPFGADFLHIWTGSYMALHDKAMSLNNMLEFNKIANSIIGYNINGNILWNYSPSFLLIISPISLIPYIPAFLLWISISLCIYLFVLYRIAPDSMTIKLALAFPGAFLNLVYGQGGFIIASLMGGGLLLVQFHPVIAGCLFGLIMSYKPQLGFLIPIALVAGRQWKALGALVAVSLGLVVVSASIFGVEIWINFLKNLFTSHRIISEDNAVLFQFVTVFGSVRLLGGSYLLAMITQSIVTITVVIVVYHIWTTASSLAVRSATLVVGSLLATPYALFYDLAIIFLSIAWIGFECQKTNWRPQDKFMLGFIWLSPMLALGVIKVGVQVEPIFLGIFFLFLVHWQRYSR